jgi:hypothetical protein
MFLPAEQRRWIRWSRLGTNRPPRDLTRPVRASPPHSGGARKLPPVPRIAHFSPADVARVSHQPSLSQPQLMARHPETLFSAVLCACASATSALCPFPATNQLTQNGVTDSTCTRCQHSPKLRDRVIILVWSASQFNTVRYLYDVKRDTEGLSSLF